MQGLSSAEARQLLQYGPNTVAEDHPHPWLLLLRKFWAPAPWMLEEAIGLQFALGQLQKLVSVMLVPAYLPAMDFIRIHAFRHCGFRTRPAENLHRCAGL